MQTTLSTSLRELRWMSPLRIKQLDRFGLRTVEDLLTHFPKRYEDRRTFDRFPRHESEQPVCVHGVVREVVSKRIRGGRLMIEVTLEEGDSHAFSPPLVCRWFNAYYVQKIIVTGQQLIVFGKPKLRAGRIFIDHPEFEIVEGDEENSIHLNRITPVYRATEGLSQRMLRAAIFRVLESLGDDEIEDRLPANLDSMRLREALQQIHFPESFEKKEAARRHLVLNEFFAMQLFIAAKRAETISRPGEAHCGKGDLLVKFHKDLPFPLTNAQRRVIEEIRADLASSRPMNRLLHGDVGAGKTVVALSAMLLCVEAGFQAALMAPTQILAEQHYLVCKRWLAPLGVRIALRTGSKKTETAMPLFDHDAWKNSVLGKNERPRFDAEPQVIIGTHALIYEGVSFSNLGLAVIDEQHKFGVMQRAKLIEQGKEKSASGAAPDVLVMTATPIPRTLTMTLFGDLDVSTLDEMPASRGKIITAVRDAKKLPDAVAFIRVQLESGRQAYVVYPIIDESEKLQAKAATAEFEKWKTLLAPMRCELLHGRIEAAEKDAIMERFRRGETHALISTSVIEVGIDVPNATIMLIENAERFGLAQLHQLRGRIGRGEHKSYCVLISNASGDESEHALEKLKIMEQTANGFEIAEHDLRLRGPGDILGTAQSGLPPLKLGNLLEDREMMQRARDAAAEIFRDDPHLGKKENRRFRDLIIEQKKLLLSQIS